MAAHAAINIGYDEPLVFAPEAEQRLCLQTDAKDKTGGGPHLSL